MNTPTALTPENKPSFLKTLAGKADILFAFGLLGTVLLLMLPVPALLMDFLLAVSIGISLLMMIIVVYVKQPAEFAVFPTILLAVTLFRLGLNIASTRLILLDGYAGDIIECFGRFVVRGNYVVGAVVFAILVIINFIVITKGAGRIAEVSARFTLDALPGKQMAIDAELNAGLIDEATARIRRKKIQKEADFYGSMDGSSKFVRGDAVAGILVTLINIFGGIAIGIFQKGLDIMSALQKYTLLSIGDGLVSQVPALIVSVAAGILITRTGEEKDLATSTFEQMTLYPKAIGVVGAMLIVFAFVPGLPSLPFLLLGGLFLWLAKALLDSQSEAQAMKSDASGTAIVPMNPADAVPHGMGTTLKDFEKVISLDTFAIELGYGLVSLADIKQGGDLIDRITGVRKQFAKEMGMIVPPIALRDNPELDAHQYRFLLRGKSVAEGIVYPKRLMAIQSGIESLPLKGIPTKEPVFGLSAFWIEFNERKDAEHLGYTIVDGPSVVVTHLTEVLKAEAHRILEREDTQKLLDIVKDKNPTLVGELIPDLVNVGLIQRVLQNLLRERISIKHLTVILETIADVAPFSKNPDELSEAARKRLGIYFVPQYESAPGKLQAITLDPYLEQTLMGRIKKTQFEISLLLDSALAQHLLQHLNLTVAEMIQAGLTPIILVTSDVRLAFKRFFEPSFKQLVVLSYQELPASVQIEPFGMITAPQPALTAEV